VKIRLQQTFGAHAGRTREFDQDVVTFGRLPTSDVAFDPHADLDASGSHAEIRREGRVWVLRDVGSRNGTLVGGRPIERHELAQGDEIEFGTGGPRVRVELVEDAAPVGHGTLAATPILAPAPAPAAPPEAKKYGQATLDAAVEAAAAKARAEAMAHMETQRAPKGTALMPQPGVAQVASAPMAAPAPATDGSSTFWMIAAIIGLFVFLSLCLVSCVVLGWLYSGGL